MKPHIHFHSDCSFFAGCENMLANFFEEGALVDEFKVSFSYRYTAAYESGFKSRVRSNINSVSLTLLDPNDFLNRTRFKPLQWLGKIFLNIFKYWFILWNTVVLYRFFRNISPDILHVNNGGHPGASSCLSAVYAARLRGIRNIVYVVNNVARPYHSLNRWLDYPMDRIVSKTASVFVTGSIHAKDKLIEVLSLSPSRVLSIPNGISPRPVTETKDDILRRLRIDKGRPLLVVVAVMEKRKGHIYLLKALQLTKEISNDEIAPPLVLIEGAGSLFNELKEFVFKTGLSGQVRFVGHEESVFNIMAAADIIVLPSISDEDFPNVILEAMSLGKPIIASRLAGIPEQIEHRKTGLLVAPKDVAGLANAINELVDDSLLRDTLGKNAAVAFENKFHSRIAVENYKRLYKGLLTLTS